jgi:hypothetical protein
VDGGFLNTVSGNYSVVAGGRNNLINPFGICSVIGGGSTNLTSGSYSVVCGGVQNSVGDECTIVGGWNNTVCFGANSQNFSTVLGGQYNTITQGWSIILGGNNNNVTTQNGTIVNGFNNFSSAQYSVIFGVSGVAAGRFATIMAGSGNAASGDFSTAAGVRARIRSPHTGASLFVDSTNADRFSHGPDTFGFVYKSGVIISGGNAFLEINRNVPATAVDVGRPGQVAFDSSHIYYCIDFNSWVRASLAAW